MRDPVRLRQALLSRTAWTVAAAVVLVTALCCARLFGLVNVVSDSPAVIAVLGLPFLIAFALGYQTGLAVGLAAVAAMIVALQAANAAFSPLELMVTVGPWLAGRIVRSRRRLAGQLRARNDELLAQQEAYAAEAVRYERSRIATELHDLVGHSLSLMVVQASAAQRAARGDEERARAALEIVAKAAREAQAELGALAGLLSDDPPAPLPDGLGLVEGLVRQARGAGLAVTYRLVSDDGDVAAMQAAVAGRVVTEALTNALKHAPGAAIRVEVRKAGTAMEVTVENGPAVGTPNGLGQTGGGHGLAGMRDRVHAAGGRFSAGPAGDGGWRVHATLPAQELAG
jgi:signal transduction histidine kinase